MCGIFVFCNYWLVNEVLFEGMVPQTKITDPALKKIFRRLNMNSDLYLLVKRAHPSHGGYRIFIVAKLDAQFNWDVFHNEQFRESYSEAAKRVFESFKTKMTFNLLAQILATFTISDLISETLSPVSLLNSLI